MLAVASGSEPLIADLDAECAHLAAVGRSGADDARRAGRNVASRRLAATPRIPLPP